MSALTRLETAVVTGKARQIRSESTVAADRLAVTLAQAGQHAARLERAVKEASR